MANTQWTNSSDQSNRDSGRFDGRVGCVNWLAARLDENDRMIARDQHTTSFQSSDDAPAAAETGWLVPVAARAWMAAAFVAASLLIVHLIAG